MQAALHVLNASRDENIKLNEQILDSVGLMTVAKNDRTTEMAGLCDNTERLSLSTEKIASLYAGEEQSLAERINHLSDTLNHYSNLLNQSLTESARSLELASGFSQTQQAKAGEYSRKLDEQIQALLSIRDTLRQGTENFTVESDEYVQRTLDSLDAGLAEVVERLMFTTAAIREAVDALPVALRPSIHYDQN